MPRLTHSLAGYIRSLQMSSKEIWVLVEGLVDRVFYGTILTAEAPWDEGSVQVSLAREVPSSCANGKEALLALYRVLRRRGLLDHDFQGKRTLVVFCLDKDVDDVTRRKARSPHVMYTEWYGVENYVFRHGAIDKALASAAELDLPSVRQRVGSDSVAWANRATANWEAWIEFCLLIRAHRIGGLPNYGVDRPSLYADPYGVADAAELARLLQRAESQAGMAPSQFAEAQRRIARRVARRKARGELDCYFNGKWYGLFAEQDARSAAGGRQYSHQGLHSRVVNCLLATLDYSEPWAARIRNAVATLFFTEGAS